MTESFEIIRQQAAEIERLRFALYGCLVASKRTDPVDYAPSLDFIHEQAHKALYGGLIDYEPIERVKITYKWQEAEYGAAT